MKKWIAAWTLLAILAAVTARAPPAEQAEGGQGVPLYYLVPEGEALSLIPISGPTRHAENLYAAFFLI